MRTSFARPLAATGLLVVLLLGLAEPAAASEIPLDFSRVAEMMNRILPGLLQILQLLGVSATVGFATFQFFQAAKAGNIQDFFQGLLLLVLAGFVLAPGTYLHLLGMDQVAAQVDRWLGRYGSDNVGAPSAGTAYGPNRSPPHITADGVRYWGGAEQGVIVFRGPRDVLVTCEGRASSDEAMLARCRDLVRRRTTDAHVPDRVTLPRVHSHTTADGTRYWGGAEQGVIVFRGPRNVLVTCKGREATDEMMLVRCRDLVWRLATDSHVPEEIHLPSRRPSAPLDSVSLAAPTGSTVTCVGTLPERPLKHACRARLEVLVAEGTVPRRIEIQAH